MPALSLLLPCPGIPASRYTQLASLRSFALRQASFVAHTQRSARCQGIARAAAAQRFVDSDGDVITGDEPQPAVLQC